MHARNTVKAFGLGRLWLSGFRVSCARNNNEHLPGDWSGRLKDVFGDPDGDPLGGLSDRVAIMMPIARGRLGLGVTE